MEKSVLKQSRIPQSNKNQKEKDVMELTSSPNYTEIQNNINDLSDPPRVEQNNPSTQIVQPTKDNGLQPIINNENGVFDNVDSIFTIFYSHY